MSNGTQSCRSIRCIVNSLAESDLLDLLRGDILALRWPTFYDEGACEILAERLRLHPARGFYENGPHIGRVGMAYFEAGTEEAKRRYYDQAARSIAMLRQACMPYANPIDLLRLVLEEAWPAGACVERVEGQSMFVGLVRIFENGHGARPHQDVLEWDAPAECAGARTLLGQLSANVYLQPSSEGGELELWDFGVKKDVYDQLRLPGAVALDRARLPDAVLRIAPTRGELILFNSTKIHAVRPTTSGTRITASSFIGVRGRSEPLSLWS